MKNWLTKIKNLVDIKINSGSTVININDKIIVNGRVVDPSSEEGKKIKKEIAIEMNNLEKEIESEMTDLSKEMEKMGKELSRMFDNLL